MKQPWHKDVDGRNGWIYETGNGVSARSYKFRRLMALEFCMDDSMGLRETCDT